MAKVAITEQYLTDIADAIREKTGLSNTFFPSEMAPAILTISGSGGITPTGTITITENNTYDVTRYASAIVNVPTGSAINNQNKSVTPTKLQQQITYDSGYTGLGTVTVNAIPANYIEPTGTLSITSNGTQDVTEYASVSVNVSGGGAEINNQDKTVSPTTSKQTITADSGYTGLGTVTVNAIPTGTAGTPTASKGTVTNHSITVTPSVTNTTGYITGSTKTGTAVTVSASELVSGTKSISANGTNIDVTNYAAVDVAVSSGAPVIQSLSVTPTTSEQTFNSSSVDGYKPVVVAAMSTGSATAPATISGTSASVSTGTNTLTLSKTISVTPTVSAGYVSSGTAGNSSVSLTASVTTKAATTYHPSTMAQTIASGTYLTGTQTINAVTTYNLVASNIVSGVRISVGDSFDTESVAGVTGSVVLQNYYTGSSAPSSSLGSNGDIYLQS